MTWRVPNPQELYQPIRIALGALSKYLDQMEAENNPAWIAPTMGNGWVDYGAGWYGAGYRKLRNGNVELRGLIKNGTTATTVFTLPVGYRPVNGSLLFPVIGGNAIGRVDVATNGNVSVDPITNVGFVDLNFTFSTKA